MKIWKVGPGLMFYNKHREEVNALWNVDRPLGIKDAEWRRIVWITDAMKEEVLAIIKAVFDGLMSTWKKKAHLSWSQQADNDARNNWEVCCDLQPGKWARRKIGKVWIGIYDKSVASGGNYQSVAFGIYPGNDRRARELLRKWKKRKYKFWEDEFDDSKGDLTILIGRKQISAHTTAEECRAWAQGLGRRLLSGKRVRDLMDLAR